MDLKKKFEEWQAQRNIRLAENEAKKLIKKIKETHFPDSTYVGPHEEALLPQGVFIDQFLWSIKEYFKGVVLDMSTPRHWHQLIYSLPAVEKVLISDLKNEYIELRGHKSKVDIIGDFCAAELPMDENSVDTIYCASILEHCESPMDMILNLKKIVRPNGYLIFMAPFAYIDGHMYPDYWRFCKDGYELLAKKADLEVLQTGEMLDLGKYLLEEYGVDCSATKWHRGIPAFNWMIARKKP